MENRPWSSGGWRFVFFPNESKLRQKSRVKLYAGIDVPDPQINVIEQSRLHLRIFKRNCPHLNCISRASPARSTATSRRYRTCRSSHSLHSVRLGDEAATR